MTSFAFPSDRADRTTLLTGPVPEDRLAFWALSEHIAYPDIRSIVADYINATVPDPVGTRRHGWSVTALPSTDASTDRRRLLTLTFGNFETLFITEFASDEDDSIELEMTVNTEIPDGYSGDQLNISTEIVSASPGAYPTNEVWTWKIDLGALLTDEVEVDFGIPDDQFDDLAYALNSRLMAGSTGSDTGPDCEDLAADLLAEAYRQLRDSGNE